MAEGGADVQGCLALEGPSVYVSPAFLNEELQEVDATEGRCVVEGCDVEEGLCVDVSAVLDENCCCVDVAHEGALVKRREPKAALGIGVCPEHQQPLHHPEVPALARRHQRCFPVLVASINVDLLAREQHVGQLC